jgi:peptidoglycan/LPS O-acetylase OafA/YrhL
MKYLIVSQLLFLQALPHVSWVFLAHLKSAHFAPLLGSPLPVASVGAHMSCATVPEICWSLSIEEYFYLLWAPVVLRFSRRTVVVTALTVIGAEMVLRWLAGAMFAYFSLIFRFDALLFGALLAILLEHWRHHAKPAWADRMFTAVAAASALALAGVLSLISPILGREIRVSVLYLVFGLPLFSLIMTALLGLIILHQGGRRTKLLRSPVLVFVGTISYTMYLVHLFAAIGIDRVVTRSPFTQAILASLLTIAVAYASWHWLEKPLLRWKDRRFPNTPHPAEPAV